MEERTWTPAQRKAIYAKDRTLLVSAAAGSGKTAVLTERIIQALTAKTDPADISRMLIVTFTRAAATQLRQKISTALTKRLATEPESKHLAEQLMLLGSAHISTIDAFYLDVVKANFQAVGFPPTFRMADESELLPLRREIMDAAIDRMFAEEKDFSVISDIFCDIKSEEALSNTLIAVADKLSKLPDGIDHLLSSAKTLETCCDSILFTPFGDAWLRDILSTANTGIQLLSRTISDAEADPDAGKTRARQVPFYAELLARCKELCEIGNAVKARKGDPKALYERIRTLLNAPFATELGTRPKESEALTKRLILCKTFADDWKSAAEVRGANSAEELRESALESAFALRLLHRVLQLYSEQVFEEKKRRELFEFSDVSRAAYRLLVDEKGEPTPLAKEIRGSYDSIYIDEYQDVDAMQDATFRAIAGPHNRFLVGDIKQSIYRFRGAQPTVFAGYRKRFPPLGRSKRTDGATIFMSNCFRCDENVIRFSNAVSGFLFSRNAESIGYSAEDDLVFSKSKEKSGTAKCRVLVLEKMTARQRGFELSSAALEARMIAEEIRRLLREGKKADGSPVLPGDIAVISRNALHFQDVVKELNAFGIPCNDISKQSFFENPEVLCMYSLLATIDNPFRDVYLAAALRSPFFGFTLEELVRIRAVAEKSLSLYEALCLAREAEQISAELREKIAAFADRLALYRDKAQYLPVDKLLRYLYKDTAVLAFAGFEEDGRGHLIRKSNLTRLYEYARSFEAGGFKGLYQFIRYVDGVMENGAEIPQPEGDKNAVLFTTIHRSKGLEFPICFLTSTQGSTAKRESGPAFLSDEHIGCALRLPNAGPFSRYDTFFRRAIETDLARQSREEEMRLLYVGMTRAIEQLIVTAVPPSKNATLIKQAELQALDDVGDMAIGNSYLSWILAALQRPDADDFSECEYRVEQLPESEDDADESGEKVDTSAAFSEKELAEAEADLQLLRERFAFRYPYAHLSRLPAKLSVSRLSPTVLDVYDSDNAPSPTANDEADAERLLHTFERVPCFGKREPDAAARGTATHEFLQFCDFARAERDPRGELQRLIAERYLSPDTEQAVQMEELERFFKSRFYGELSKARSLHRETRFHIFLPADRFTADPAFAVQLEKEHLAVQGVIDLFYENEQGELILCDYKTDRLTPYELSHPYAAAQKLSARHGEQLSYYKTALEQICGKAPDRILIYSLPLGEAIDVILPN